MPTDPHHRPRLQPTPPASELLYRDDDQDDGVDHGTTRSLPPADARASRWVWGLTGALAVGLLAIAVVTFRGETTPDTSVAARGAAPVATPVVLETVELFPLREPVRFAGQRVRLDELQVTEILDDRFVYVRPADHLDHAPALVDLRDARDVDLRVGALLGIRGVLRPTSGFDRAGLSDLQRTRLDEATVIVDADAIVAPPER